MTHAASRREPSLPDTLELRPARLHDLAAMRAFVAAACEVAGASAAERDALVLAADEVCANVLVHGYRGADGGPLRLAVGREDGAVVVTIADEAPPFDPGTVAAPVTDTSAEERVVGGLGWHLVRRSVDEVRWRGGERGRGNEVTLVKRCVKS